MTPITFIVLQFALLISYGCAETIVSLGRTNVNEWFSKKIVPTMFNLTLDEPDQFEFEFSLRGYPNLPSWIQFMYSTEYNAGYLYGTPPEKVAGHEVMSYFVCVCVYSIIPGRKVISHQYILL